MGILGKKKKLDEDKLKVWVEKFIEKGKSLQQIRNVLEKKYPVKDIAEFMKKHYPESKEDKNLDTGMEAETKKQEEMDELDKEMEGVTAEAKGKEFTEATKELETKEEPKEEPKEIPIQRMSTYDIELLNRIASIDENIRKLVDKK